MIPSSQQSRLRIALVLMIFQQLTGINAVLFFAESICLISNVSSPPLCAFFIGLFQMIFTILASFIINLIRRKTLLKFSAFIMAIALLAYGITISTYSFNSIITEFWILLFIFGYSIGWGPLPVLVSMELFPVDSRGNAISAAIAVNWISAFIITEIFKIMSGLIDPAVLFITFSMCCFISIGYVQKYLPETSSQTTGSTGGGDILLSSSYKSQLSA
ncbi:unnamed protein product [Schistosoma turkestanicum]|nr:unnamed protein product [Schistosoma turkestanicum]